MRFLLVCLITVVICFPINVNAAAELNNDSRPTINSAWFVDYKNEPGYTSINGLQIEDISNEYQLFNVLECYRDFTIDQCESIKASGAQMSAIIDINGDGRLEFFHIGSAIKQTGSKVKFLVMQDFDTGAVIDRLEVEGDGADFHALYLNDGHFMWSMCLNCDVFVDVVWKNNQLAFEYLEFKEPETHY